MSRACDFRHMAACPASGYDRSRMKPLRAETVFQAGGLLAWAVVGFASMAPLAATIDREMLVKVPDMVTPAQLATLTAVFWAFVLGLFLAFGLAFRANTRSVQGSPPSRRSVVLLVLQVALAATMSSDMLYIVAAEVPFVLAGRAAAAWMGAQAVATVGLGLHAFATGSAEPLAGVQHLGPAAVITLTLLSSLSWQALAFGGGWLAAAQVRSRRELERVNAELQATGDLLAGSARMAERVRIARELHDTMGHHLTALSMELELAGRLAEGRTVAPVQEAHAVARLLLSDVREVVATMREDRGLDLEAALATLAAGIAEPRVALDLAHDVGTISPVVAHALFRVAQEALTNAIRHADARTVRVTLGRGPEGLELAVADDGRGARALQPGHGLRGMRERVEELGGRLEIVTSPGQGLTVRAVLPGGPEHG